MRKLARITKVDGFAPIEGADRIVAAHVGGWTVITPKAAQTDNEDALFIYLEGGGRCRSRKDCRGASGVPAAHGDQGAGLHAHG